MVVLRGPGPLAAALSPLEDVQALSQAAEGGGRCGFEQEQVLVQAGERAFGGERVNGLNQVLLLAFCLGHHLKRRGTRESNYKQFPLPAFVPCTHKPSTGPNRCCRLLGCPCPRRVIERSAGVFCSLLEACTATSKDVLKMEHTIVLHVVNIY